MALASMSLRDARVQAYRHPLVAPPPLGFRGGLVVGDGPAEQALRQTRYWRPADDPTPDARAAETIDGDCIYGGPVYAHFGHFMAEMAHRLLPSREQGARGTWLFAGVRGDPALHSVATAPAFFRDVLAYFDVAPETVRVLTAHAVVRHLHASEAASDFGGGPKPGYVEALARHGADWRRRHGVEAASVRDVYVSRRYLPRGGTFLGELYLEALLEARSVTIFAPERHSLLEQMNVYRSAACVVFPEGSACHGTELLGAGEMGSCVLLVRRPDHVEIFRRVLRPRSRSLHVLDAAVPLGSLVGPPGGPAWPHAGVAVLDPGALRRGFAEAGMYWFDAIDPAAYFAAARRDLDTYRREAAAAGMLTSADDARAVLRAFTRARRRLRAGG